MPEYCESEQEEGLPEDDKKVYSTVSLCCLSVTNPFRNQIIQIVCVHPWFDRFILLVICVNCLFLALDKEVDAVTDNIETIDLVFLIIYTFEMIMKVIAMGFVMRMNSYLRDTWNVVSQDIYTSLNLIIPIYTLAGFLSCYARLDLNVPSG